MKNKAIDRQGTGDGSPFPKLGTENRPLFPARPLKKSSVPCDKNPGISAGVCVKVCRKAAHFILFVYLAVCFDLYSFVDSEYVAEIVGVCCVSVIIFAAAAES